MKKKITGAVLIALIVFAAGWNYQQNQSESELSDLTLANVNAIAQNEAGGNATAYNRHPFQCTIYGNGKVKIAGGSILEVKGQLSFDGGLYCTDNGNATCTPMECFHLWQWVFN
jgi:hypothetical protein